MSAVLDKIRAETPQKNGFKLARARQGGRVVRSLSPDKLQDLLSPYLKRAVRAWVDGLKANKIGWNQETQKWEDTGFADHKERRESARAIIEYFVGKAIERTLNVSGSYKELSQVLEELKQSPEARRILPPEIWGMVASAPAPSVEEKPVDQNQNSGTGSV
jgi:hypothetical protein